MLFEMIVLPFLLNLSETWTGLNKKCMEELNTIHKTFLQRLLKIRNCPTPLMFFDLGQMKMKYQIQRRILLFLHHVAHLDENSLANEFYIEQKKNPNLPGLVADSREILLSIDLTLPDMEKHSKEHWKRLVTERLRNNKTRGLKVDPGNQKKITSSQA